MTPPATFYEWQKLLITLTNRCNLICRMCSIIHDARATLPESIAFHAADFAERRGFREIEVSGGEATLVPYFWRLLDRLCAIDADIKLVTNGVKLTSEQVRALAAYPNLHVQISIDGPAKTHDAIRGATGAFERSARSLEGLAEAGCRGLSINTVVQRSNYTEMVEVYERFKHLPLRYHAFSLIEEQDVCVDEMIDPALCGAVLGVLREVRQRAEADGNDVVLSEELLQAFRRRVSYPHFMMHPGKGCTVVRRGLLITHDGYARPCWHYHWDATAINRSLHERTLDEIVDSPEVIAELRRVIGRNGCRGCSTSCYHWDPDYRRKVMAPRGAEQIRQVFLVGKERLRQRHPGLFKAAKQARDLLPL